MAVGASILGGNGLQQKYERKKKSSILIVTHSSCTFGVTKIILCHTATKLLNETGMKQIVSLNFEIIIGIGIL